MIYYGAADVVGWSGGVLFMIAAVALLVDEFLFELARLGHTRWPRLGRCLHWGALKVTVSNRRCRSAHRHFIEALRRNPFTRSTNTTQTVPTAVTTIPIRSGPYHVTTGASLERNRFWSLRRQ